MRQFLCFCINLLLLSVNFVSACQDGKFFVLFAVNSLALKYVNVTISIYLKAGLKTNRSPFSLQTPVDKKGRINLTNDVTKTNSSFVIQFGNQETAAVTEQQQQWNEMGLQNISFCTEVTVF